MTRNQEHTLLGWDDGKIYFMDESGTERCVNDYSDLLVDLEKVCNKYFNRQKNNRKRRQRSDRIRRLE